MADAELLFEGLAQGCEHEAESRPVDRAEAPDQWLLVHRSNLIEQD
jgi:hypothetical protein